MHFFVKVYNYTTTTLFTHIYAYGHAGANHVHMKHEPTCDPILYNMQMQTWCVKF